MSRSKADLDGLFAGGVQGARGLIEDEQVGIAQEGARQGDALALSARQLHAPFAHQGVEPVGEAFYKVEGEGRSVAACLTSLSEALGLP